MPDYAIERFFDRLADGPPDTRTERYRADARFDFGLGYPLQGELDSFITRYIDRGPTTCLSTSSREGGEYADFGANVLRTFFGNPDESRIPGHEDMGAELANEIIEVRASLGRWKCFILGERRVINKARKRLEARQEIDDRSAFEELRDTPEFEEAVRKEMAAALEIYRARRARLSRKDPNRTPDREPDEKTLREQAEWGLFQQFRNRRAS